MMFQVIVKRGLVTASHLQRQNGPAALMNLLATSSRHARLPSRTTGLQKRMWRVYSTCTHNSSFSFTIRGSSFRRRIISQATSTTKTTLPAAACFQKPPTVANIVTARHQRYLSVSSTTATTSTTSSSYDETNQPSSTASTTSSLTTVPTAKHTTTTTTTAAASISKDSTRTAVIDPLPLPRLYRCLKLTSFTEEELEDAFDRIRLSKQTVPVAIVKHDDDVTIEEKTSANTAPTESTAATSSSMIDASHIQAYLWNRVLELEQEGIVQSQEQQQLEGSNDARVTTTTKTTTLPKDRVHQLRHEYCAHESLRFLQIFADNTTATNDSKDNSTINNHNKSSNNSNMLNNITKDQFVQTILTRSSQIDIQHTWPITVSMLLVGASVGVLQPAMPFVVESLQLTTGQYGAVVSAFALAKMAFNIPAAIAVERYGRKPFMTNSLVLIAAGVGGIGMATSFSELYLCRLCTGLGVAALGTAATMMITDLSTPRSRASTLAPIMSAFSAGTALGPALGGYCVDHVGLNPTFYVVGLSYFGVAGLNYTILDETKTRPMSFPWQDRTAGTDTVSPKRSWSQEIQKAVGQWIPLLRTPTVRNILVMNACYWVALAGSQMTLLPLILTDTNGLAMTATQVGSVYMAMSTVHIIGNPVFARLADRLGKAPAISGGCTLISAAMATLPFCDTLPLLAGSLGMWSVGSSMLSTAPIALISDKVDERQRAQAIALLRTCGDVGFLIGASGTGALADWAGSLDFAMQSSAGLLLTATAWFTVRQILSAKLAADDDRSKHS